MVASVRSPECTGRPLVPMTVNGTTILCFVDTGSEATIMKPKTLQFIDPHGNLYRKDATHVLKGVSNKPLDTLYEVTLPFYINPDIQLHHRVAVCDIRFPGDVLLGMDFLRRTSYCLSSDAKKDWACLTIEGCTFPVTYTDAHSMQIGIVDVDPEKPTLTSSQLKTLSANLHLRRTMELPPHTGRFVEGVVAKSGPSDGDVIFTPQASPACLSPYIVTTISGRHCPVWALNDTAKTIRLTQGTRLGTVATIEEIYSSGHGSHEDKDPADANCSTGWDDDMQNEEFIWEDDQFDRTYGLEDFGSDNYDFFTGELPPSQALAAVEASGLLDDAPVQDNSPALKLDHLDSTQKEKIQTLLNQYQLLFDGGEETIGHIPNIQHRIETGDAAPVSTRQWRLPQATRNVIREQCNSMLRAGVIEPSTSPWLSPVVLVKKKGGALRFCVDYRKLNQITTADTYPLPRIDELLDELSPTDTFTTLDARAAYWSVDVHPDDRPKTAFSDGYRLFQFRRLPFGLSTAPTTFQRTMNFVLSPVLGRHTLAYLDDIVVYSRGFEQHLKDLEETLQLLMVAGLKLNAEKCTIAATSISFLGFTISPEGVAPDREKVVAIMETPAPRTIKEVRRFLGATGFFRKHIEGYANIAAPLHLLLKKGQRWKWEEDQQQAFVKLKEKLAKAPVLKQPDFTRPFELHTDASSLALGAVLLQRDDQGAPHAIAYYSRKLRDPETRYPAIDCEALAVVEGVRVFDPYLYGRKFFVFTDHRPLVYIFKQRTKSPRMTRYAHDLSFYDFDIRYKEGPTNYVPDLLSRQVAPVDVNELSAEKLAEEQHEDLKFKDILCYLKEGTVPKKKLPMPLSDFELKDGVLYRLRHMPGKIIYQLCVPQKLQDSALKTAHTPPLAMHPGIHRTYENLRGMFYWPNMLQDVRHYVERCLTCQQSRGVAQRVPMAEAPLALYPLERVSMDILDVSQAPMKWALTIVDQHTRFIQIVPMKDITASRVHQAFLDHWVTYFGPPRIIQTDNGRQFIAQIFNELVELLQSSHHFTIRYHPQANGLVERTNRVVKAALRSVVGDRPGTWHKFIPELRLALNSAIHRSTGEQPLYLLTGRHAYFPVGLTNEALFAENDDFQERLRTARRAAVNASRDAQGVYGRYYNRHARGNFTPDVGQLVWYKEMVPRPLGPKWQGPARVVKRLGPVSFEIQDLDSGKILRAHLNHLRPYLPPLELSYADDAAPDSEDEPVNDDPWVAVLTSCVQDPVLSDKQCA